MAEKHEGGWEVPPPYVYFNPFQIHSWLTLLVLGPIFVDGCIRRSLFQPQTTSTTTTTTTTLRPASTPSMDETTGTTIVSSHKQQCLEDEVQSTNCLHGGTCYVVVLNEQRQSFCHCTEDWTGKRCEQYFIDPGILASMEQNMRTANIAAGVSVCILVLFVLLLASYVYLRYRRKQKVLLNAEFGESAEGLCRRPSSKRSSVVESVCRAGSLLKPPHICPEDGEAETATYDLNGNGRLQRDGIYQPPLTVKSTSL